MTKIPASVFLRNLSKIDLSKLIKIKGIGKVMVSNLQFFCHSANYQKLIDKFENLEKQNKGLEIILTRNSSIGKVENYEQNKQKVVCVTGTFNIPRSEIIEFLESKNYKVSGTLTKDTQFLLVGQKPGSKLVKAQEMGIIILENWQDLE